MSDLHVTLVPIGKVDAAEIEAVAARVAKILARPIELRRPAAVPRSSEDTARGQHRAAAFLAEARLGLPRLAVDKIIGTVAPAGGLPAAAPSASPPAAVIVPVPHPDAVIFLTDVDLFTPNAEGVFGEIDTRNKCAVLSVRRLREAFYKRKADPAKQRARVVKLVLQTVGRLKGLADCKDSRCVMAPTGALADIDLKDERFCGVCSRRLTTGIIRI